MKYRRILDIWHYAAIEADTPTYYNALPVLLPDRFWKVGPFSGRFSGSVFEQFVDRFWTMLAPFLEPFSMLFSLLFWGRRLHRFSIDFGRVFGCIFDGFWMTSPSAHPPGKTFKFDDPSDEFTCFTLQESMFLHAFRNHLRCHLCIDFEWVSAPISDRFCEDFAYIFNGFRHWISINFPMVFLMNFAPFCGVKSGCKNGPRISPEFARNLNRSRGSFWVDFGHFLGPFLDPFWYLFLTLFWYFLQLCILFQSVDPERP